MNSTRFTNATLKAGLATNSSFSIPWTPISFGKCFGLIVVANCADESSFVHTIYLIMSALIYIFIYKQISYFEYENSSTSVTPISKISDESTSKPVVSKSMQKTLQLRSVFANLFSNKGMWDLQCDPPCFKGSQTKLPYASSIEHFESMLHLFPSRLVAVHRFVGAIVIFDGTFESLLPDLVVFLFHCILNGMMTEMMQQQFKTTRYMFTRYHFFIKFEIDKKGQDTFELNMCSYFKPMMHCNVTDLAIAINSVIYLLSYVHSYTC